MSDAHAGYTLQLPPEPAGHFALWDGFTITANRRPSWLHRTAMRLVFGWRWHDTVPPKGG